MTHECGRALSAVASLHRFVTLLLNPHRQHSTDLVIIFNDEHGRWLVKDVDRFGPSLGNEYVGIPVGGIHHIANVPP